MKIIGFSQLHNEMEKGNLENWMSCMQEICDYIYIYDQASTDGSKGFYKKFNNVIVIESPINDFENELICKNTLLKKIIKEQLDADWITWFDGDTIIDGRLLNYNKIRDILNLIPSEINGLDLNHFNLWRSDIHYRVDDNYDYFGKVGRTAFWRFNKDLSFPQEKGLHSPNNERPLQINSRIRLGDYALIHRGFASDSQIVERYEMYKSKGQTGNMLQRLILENGLQVEELDRKYLPSWFEIKDDENPLNKKRIVDLMEK